MAKIKYNLEIGFCGCNEEDEIEIDDNMSDEEIQAMVDEMAQEHACSWEGDERLYSAEEWEDPEIVEEFYACAYGSFERLEE